MLQAQLRISRNFEGSIAMNDLVEKASLEANNMRELKSMADTIFDDVLPQPALCKEWEGEREHFFWFTDTIRKRADTTVPYMSEYLMTVVVTDRS